MLRTRRRRLTRRRRRAAAVEAATELEEPFSAGELPGPLDAAGRLVLVRRLIREGYLLAL